MNTKLNLNELVTIIGAKGLKPYPFNADFLQQSAIVPEDWELAKKPLHTKQAVQSQFKNNVMFTAQPNRIVVTELFVFGILLVLMMKLKITSTAVLQEMRII